MKDLGEYIKLKRKEKNLTLVQLAKVTNLTQGYLSNIERNMRKPSMETLKSIALALNVNKIDLYWIAGYYTDLEYFETLDQEKRESDHSVNEWDKYVEQQFKKEEYEQFKKLHYPDIKDLLEEKSKTYFNGRLLDHDSKKLASKILHALFEELEQNYPSNEELKNSFRNSKRSSNATSETKNKNLSNEE